MKIFFYTAIIVILAGCDRPVPQSYFVFLNTNPDREILPDSIVQNLQGRHLANIDSLSKSGRITAAGPFYNGGGIFILQANNLNHANKVLQTDPAIRANRYIIEVLPLQFVKGDNCSFTEPVEMITLGLFRFETNDNHFPAEQLDDFKKRLAKLSYMEDVLILAEFDKKGNGIMILNHEMTDEWSNRLYGDPVFEEGLLDLSARNLWIAKGTFCPVSDD